MNSTDFLSFSSKVKVCALVYFFYDVNVSICLLCIYDSSILAGCICSYDQILNVECLFIYQTTGFFVMFCICFIL